MAEIQVMFGTAKKAPKAQKANPSTKKVVMSPAPMIGGSLDSAYKEPTHEERLHRAAADEHVHATRDYVGGRISKAQYEDRKKRAESVMAKTPKSRS
jgi:hypothetical protein